MPKSLVLYYIAALSRKLQLFTNGFALWVTLGAVLAWIRPDLFTWFKPYIGPGLGVIMLGMGITLSFKDFKEIFKRPGAIGVGVGAQFIIMPLLGWSLATAFRLERDLAVGLILVSCCPGGTASNVIAFLGRANLPLSVLMTMCSTFMAIFLTPLLTDTLASHYMEISATQMLLTTVQIVLIPIVVGILLNQYFPNKVRAAKDAAPLVSVIVIVLIVSCIIGLNQKQIQSAGASLFIAVLLLHLGGFVLGYLLVKLLGYPEDYRRTVSIEVGMQNSGLGTKLATDISVTAAAPCAISAVYHCIIGSFLAAYWRRKVPVPSPEKE
ncbi:bile acid:sodium symporter family protein [Verrucomicrobia bacterium]|nr:bile acid:sodium symporter family protein [Verrucomicrobiota bacterium]